MVKGLEVFRDAFSAFLDNYVLIGGTAGKRVDERDVRKQRNDILRLARVVDPSLFVQAPDEVTRDLREALQALAIEPDLRLRDLGLRNASLEELLGGLRSAFGLGDDR